MKTENEIKVKSSKSYQLKGTALIPGDKSISQRALIIALITNGITKIEKILQSQDVKNTLKAVQALGAQVKNINQEYIEINGRGLGLIKQTQEEIYLGNSGTATRILMGVLASHPIDNILDGDHSLRKRPMKRVIEPLKLFGAKFYPKNQNDTQNLPVKVCGTRTPTPIEYDINIPSAQVKSAILLAALNMPGISHFIEKIPTRDHTETILKQFGADIKQEFDRENRKHIWIKGYQELKPQTIQVPADPSSAAFLIAAALIVPESEITVENVLINQYRDGFFHVIKKMNADISIHNIKKNQQYTTADITARYSKLKPAIIEPHIVPKTIDELPIIAMLAANADGKSRFDGVAELKIKESDRISSVVDGLRKTGVECQAGDDWIEINGNKKINDLKKQSIIKTHMDHRIAMSFIILGLNAQKPIIIDDIKTIETSFPNFVETMKKIGAQIEIVT